MAKTIFEKAGGTYTQVGDYMLPDLLPAEKEKEANIGVWAMRHKRYLKQNHKVRYYNLLTSGKLNSYLADIEQQAQDLFLRLVKELAKRENVNEKLKAENQMLWVQKMNNIRNRATEIVNAELVYAFGKNTIFNQ
ncbi:TnpV protein [Ruminococcus bromii]|uniref:TnpV protein n=1 Tax=Ruminococcus bromii TaxID=40518 RepID=UPI002431DEF2|nr:TnpV protein [Ruminococcus bromii]